MRKTTSILSIKKGQAKMTLEEEALAGITERHLMIVGSRLNFQNWTEGWIQTSSLDGYKPRIKFLSSRKFLLIGSSNW
ncbi:hypothetical protein MA16_Dca020935 [Dendrobium catenatum]|uniref:Uncharacterized protein n=1 Tax=Dendrobium catenatum TaxID=906689 RepID=A0A2I0VZ52_9ASPA|nr:hypothetical protein MA16_Dca020935 [Dendrobium catenatum]